MRFGVYLPSELVNELYSIMNNIGIKSRSRVVQEALRLFINEYKWRYSGRVHGVIGVIYNHEIKNVDEKLTDIQHNYIENIVSTMHIHLTRDKCMLIIVIRGEGSKIYELVSGLINTRGVIFVKTMILETE